MDLFSKKSLNLDDWSNDETILQRIDKRLKYKSFIFIQDWIQNLAAAPVQALILINLTLKKILTIYNQVILQEENQDQEVDLKRYDFTSICFKNKYFIVFIKLN